MRLHSCLLTAACAVGLLGTAAAQPNHPLTAGSKDSGPTASSTLITTSIYLNVTDPQGLKNFVAATTTPGSPSFHRFLTLGQFVNRFAPSTRSIQQLVRYLQSYGLTINKIYADNLDITVTGTAAQLNAALSTQLRDYSGSKGQRFHRPAWKFVLPSELSSLVLAVPGLNNAPTAFRTHIARVDQGASSGAAHSAVTWPKSGTASGVPQQYTVGDAANFYDVNPLYRAGVQGRGQTIGIMTLANFNTADAYSYWSDIGLKVQPNRITKVLVDGGTPVAGGVGDDETSLDVEQSGGLAPQAKVRVYIAPNTNSGFMDLFYTAASENIADTVSISWGEAEEFYFASFNDGVDETSQMEIVDQALLESAAQGQSVFASSGDAGAYDLNDPATGLTFSSTLSVDSPGSDPYITAAGGTTVPTTLKSATHPNCPPIVITQEQVWGWDYLNNDWLTCHNYVPDQFFPTGGGGGVSSFFSVPFYQNFVSGMQRTQPGQVMIYYPNAPSTDGSQNLGTLPAGFAGRNVPDISLNADPETGYIVVDCTDFPPTATDSSCAASGFGGTSFVAPQLNGMTALIDQAAGGRVGLLNPMVYPLQQLTGFLRLPQPFNDITAGDNWFYSGVRGYDDGAGLGTLNVANLAVAYLIFEH
jgi:subtilase family serine protease